MSPARQVAYAVIRRVFEQGAYADRALHAEARGLDARDRALAKQLAFGTVQRKGTLDWVVGRLTEGKLDAPVRAALWLGLYQLLFLDGVAAHAAVSESVELAKPSPGHRVVNAVLRRAMREGVELPADSNPKGAAIRHSYPEWLVLRWWDWLGGAQARALMEAGNAPVELALRINTLVGEGDDLPAGRRSEDGIVVDGPLDVFASAAYRRGAVTPQSRASQRVSRVVDPQPGERVLDLCAAPGGKTTHLAALMGGEGTVVAVEQHAGRAEALRRTCARLHAGNVEVRVQDAREPVAGGPFDRVLLDPPCSGLGTLSAHPDLRWRVDPGSIAELVRLQDALLVAARAALRPGGRLVYSVCTLSPDEERLGGERVERFFPHRDGTDGFYIAADGG
jgi:16S rRNA (cytosine967-C5)-methyltransferase